MSASNDGTVDREVDRNPVSNDQRCAPTSKERVDQRLRHKIGGFLLEPDSPDGGDTLAVALCSYFERHMGRPKPDPDTENGWGQWAEAQTNSALDALTKALTPVPETPEATVIADVLEFMRLEHGVERMILAGDPSLLAEGEAMKTFRLRETLIERLERVTHETLALRHGELEQLRRIDQAARTYVDALGPHPSRHSFPEFEALTTALYDGRPAVETKAPRGKPCTCPDTSTTACGVERGSKLGELWYCRRAAEKTSEQPTCGLCGKPGITEAVRTCCGEGRARDLACGRPEKASQAPSDGPQCSWGCHYVGDRFIRYAACTVHGASQNGPGDV